MKRGWQKWMSCLICSWGHPSHHPCLNPRATNLLHHRPTTLLIIGLLISLCSNCNFLMNLSVCERHIYFLCHHLSMIFIVYFLIFRQFFCFPNFANNSNALKFCQIQKVTENVTTSLLNETTWHQFLVPLVRICGSHQSALLGPICRQQPGPTCLNFVDPTGQNIVGPACHNILWVPPDIHVSAVGPMLSEAKWTHM